MNSLTVSEQNKGSLFILFKTEQSFLCCETKEIICLHHSASYGVIRKSRLNERNALVM